MLDEHDESKLPKWAQDRLRNLRRNVERLSVETINADEVPDGVRVMISRGTRNERYQWEHTAIPLEDSDSVRFYVTGGYMDVQLSKFGSRYRVRIIGQGEYDRLAGERADIAILPAMGNVVEAAFVMQAPDRVVMPEALTLEPSRPAIRGPKPSDPYPKGGRGD